MEHRHHVRKPLKVGVDLYHRDDYLGRFETRDVNEGGVYVTLGAQALPRNAMLKLCFVLDWGDNSDVPSLAAMVIHQSREGAGMMFCHADRGALRARGALLDAAA